MSYCRFSSDDYSCDLYIYSDASGGYSTHVAGSRYVGDTPIPKVPSLSQGAIEKFVEAHRAQMNWLNAARLEPIGLPHDGESYLDPDLETLIARVEGLVAAGYQAPASLLPALREELADEADAS